MRHLCQWEGRTYGVGHAPAASVFIYRRDLLAAQGLRVPQTWDEFIATAAQLREVKDGEVVRYGLTMTGQPLFVNIAVGELLKANGGRLFDPDGRPTLTERPVVEVLEFLQRLQTVLPPGWMRQSYAETFEQLASGKTAMLSHEVFLSR